MKYLFRLISFILILTALACVRRPDGVASDSKMARVLADLELGEAWLQQASSSVSNDKRDALTEYVINKHGLSREEFDSTMSWYLRNPDAYYVLCELTEKQLLKKQKQLAGKTGLVIETANLWPYSRIVTLSPESDTDGIIFSIPTSDVTNGDQVRFKMRFDHQADGNALLGVEYESGESEYVTRHLSGASRVDVTLYTDSAKSVSRLFGNVAIDEIKTSRLWLDSISLSVQPFDSTKYYNRNSQHIIYKPSRRIKVELNDRTDESTSE